MRAAPNDYLTAVRIQWLCAAVEVLLNRRDLAFVPTLMSGFGSIVDHRAAAAFAPAAHALRLMGVEVGSVAAVRRAVYDCQEWEGARDESQAEPPYAIDITSNELAFTRRNGVPVHQVRRMVDILLAGLADRRSRARPADPARPFAFSTGEGDGGRYVGVDLSKLPELPAAPVHDFTRTPRGPIDVPLEDLKAIARDFDRIDAERGDRVARSWLARFEDEKGAHRVRLLAPDSARTGLAAVDRLRLEGLRHLIGLPGSGKTTLITLLLAWLAKHEYRALVLMPSIEAAFNLSSELERYGVFCGLLMGQSPQVRINHARKLSERLGAVDGTRGVGKTTVGVEAIALGCALGAFDADAVDPSRPFPHLDPPCERILQRRQTRQGAGAEGTFSCPLAGWCGRHEGSRRLVQRPIWLGHALSLDTRVPSFFSAVDVRFFEAVARSMDLVIFDECDGVQYALDQKAISSVDLIGSTTSLSSTLVEDVFAPAATGSRPQYGASVFEYGKRALTFFDLNRQLVSELLKEDPTRKTDSILHRYKGVFLTGNRVASDLFGHADPSALEPEQRRQEEERFGAIAAYWDACVRTALFRGTDAHGGDVVDYDPHRLSTAIGKSLEGIRETQWTVVENLRDWIAQQSPTLQSQHLAVARTALFSLIPPQERHRPEQRDALFELLVRVTSVVMQFLALVPAQHAMMAENVHKSPLFTEGISNDFARLVPDALIGQLAGVQFQYEQRSGRSIPIVSYLSFRGAPRLLMYRMHELLRHEGRARGPAVLLASATSYLAPSPSYHIPVGPDYVLDRVGGETAWRESVYLFDPITDPRDTRKKLRYSGAAYEERPRILREMVRHFFHGQTPRIESLLTDFEKGRTVAFVVNSYEQVRQVKNAIDSRELSKRVIAVVDARLPGDGQEYVTTAQVEELGARDDWDAIVFPMKSLARGVNIVRSGDLFADTPVSGKAAIGTVVFLIRPHPATESKDFVAGLAGFDSMTFDRMVHPAGVGLEALHRAWRSAREESLKQVRHLMRHSVQASRLPERLLTQFVADIMIDILQTIGRAMRNGAKCRVIFVDAAWAQAGARGEIDTVRTSFLAGMLQILKDCIGSDDPIERAVYESLYRPFLTPLSACRGVRLNVRS